MIGIILLEMEGHYSRNTGLPAPVASLLSPNPCPVTPFAEKRKRRARAVGSAIWGCYAKNEVKIPIAIY